MIVSASVFVLIILWVATAPPSHLVIQPAFEMGEVPDAILESKAEGDPLSENLIKAANTLPGYDEVILQEDYGRAFVTCMDGWIWIVDLKKMIAKRFVDAPLMAAGARQVPGNPDKIVFCASYLYGETYPEDETVGIYELTISTKAIRPLVNRAPILLSHPGVPPGNQGVVYAGQSHFSRPLAELNNDNSRPLKFCNDLDISRDGKRIYFSEPFAYEGASMGGGALGEAITLGKNGLLWCLNLDDNTIACVARGYTFLDGVLLEEGPDKKEISILITETVKFRILRLYLFGEKAGQDEVVQKDLPGMPDGLDYDSKGRIWVGLIKQRSSLVNWIHKNPWIKPLILRLPACLFNSKKETGIIAFSPDCSTPLYFTSHNGTAISDISVVVPGRDHIYLPSFDRNSKGFFSMENPLH